MCKKNTSYPPLRWKTLIAGILLVSEYVLHGRDVLASIVLNRRALQDCCEEAASSHDCFCFWLSRGRICEDPLQTCQNMSKKQSEETVWNEKRWWWKKIAHDLHSVNKMTYNHTQKYMWLQRHWSTKSCFYIYIYIYVCKNMIW